MSEIDDRATEDLVTAARLGEPDAFAQVFRRVRNRLALWVSVRLGAMLRGRVSEEDVIQETFIEAHRSLQTFKGQGTGSFFRWLASVAENRIKDMHKFHAAQKRHPGREIPMAGMSEESRGPLGRLALSVSSPSGRFEQQELVHRLGDAMDRVPPELREVLVRRAIEERTFKEIAELLGKSTAAVHVQYCRALKALKEEMGHDSHS